MSDPVNHPYHYTSHPSGVEAIEITEWYGFNIGNAIKYCFRSGAKGSAVEDLKKGAWYASRELENISNGRALRGFLPRQCETQGDKKNKEACCNKKSLPDPSVFLSEEVALRSHNGSGNFCIKKTGRNDGVPSERESSGQQIGESFLGAAQEQYSQKESSWDGAAWDSSLGRETDRGAGDLDKNLQSFGIKGCRNCRHQQISGEPHTPWDKLAAYLAYETEEWRRAAVYELAVGSIQKAVWYINREIERRQR